MFCIRAREPPLGTHQSGCVCSTRICPKQGRHAFLLRPFFTPSSEAQLLSVKNEIAERQVDCDDGNDDEHQDYHEYPSLQTSSTNKLQQPTPPISTLPLLAFCSCALPYHSCLRVEDAPMGSCVSLPWTPKRLQGLPNQYFSFGQRRSIRHQMISHTTERQRPSAGISSHRADCADDDETLYAIKGTIQ